MTRKGFLLLGLLIALTFMAGSIQAPDVGALNEGAGTCLPPDLPNVSMTQEVGDVEAGGWPAALERAGMTSAVQVPVSGRAQAPALGAAQYLNPSTARLCNGLPYLCERRIDEVTFPGNHNSGSNRGGMDWGCQVLVPAPECFYRNQGQTITGQLQFGIRYFDIDTCVCNVGIVTCHNDAIGDTISQMLDEFDAFLNLAENRNEVIFLTFGDQNVAPENVALLQGLLYDQLLRWESTPERIAKQELMMYKPLPGDPPGIWPTLGTLVARNQRIVVFVRNPIASLLAIGAISERDSIFDTYKSRECTSSCGGVVSDTHDMCAIAASYSYNLPKLVLVSVTCSQGLCIDWLAKLCQPHLLSSLNTCRDALGGVRVPSFITADYTEKYYVAPSLPIKQNIVEAVRFFNLNHLKESLTVPISNGTASHIGFESNRNGKMISSGIAIGIAFHTQWISDEELWKWVPEAPSDTLQYGTRICLQSKTTDLYLGNVDNHLSLKSTCEPNEYWTIEKYSPTNNVPVGTVGTVQAGDEICLRSELEGEYVRASPDNNYLWVTSHCESDEKWLLYAGWNDWDSDLVIDDGDNCPATFNPDQSDLDLDGLGNACDVDPYGAFSAHLPAVLRR